MINYLKLQKVFFALTFILACFPVFGFVIRSIITLLWGGVGILLYLGLNKTTQIKNRNIWFFLFPYIALVISLLYSQNDSYGLNVLIKMLSFIIFPVIFYLNSNRFKIKDRIKIIYIFSFSVLTLILYQIVSILFNLEIILQDLSPNEIKINGFNSIHEINSDVISRIKLRRFRNYIISISNSHPTYQSLWTCFSLFFIVTEIRKLTKISQLIIFAIIITVFVLWLYLISARMPVIALFISAIFSFFIFSKVQLKRKILTGIVPIIAIIILLFFQNPLSSRIKEYYDTGFSILEKNSLSSEFNSSNVRNGIYYCDFILIEKSPLFGVGIGDIQEELNCCYKENINAKIYLWQNYNSHNQYAFFWLASGVFGILSFILLLSVNILNSVKQSKIILFYLICSSSFVFLTENLLERSDGVVFFSFFMGLFYFNNQNSLDV